MDGNASNGADDGLSRRGLLMGTALLGVGTATLASGAGDAVAATSRPDPMAPIPIPHSSPNRADWPCAWKRTSPPRAWREGTTAYWAESIRLRATLMWSSMIAAIHKIIASRALLSRVPPTVDVPSRTTPGQTRRLQKTKASLATTPALQLGMIASTEPGPGNPKRHLLHLQQPVLVRMRVRQKHAGPVQPCCRSV